MPRGRGLRDFANVDEKPVGKKIQENFRGASADARNELNAMQVYVNPLGRFSEA
jgi:hypothetical protein